MKANILLIAVLGTASLLASGGEISDIHRQHTSRSLDAWKKSRSHDEVASTNHGITEIGIERTPCYGTCPSYTFIVRRDGTFHYKGDRHVERQGEFTGTIPVWHFQRLAQFIKDSGYTELEDYYSRAVTDNPTIFTMVVMNGKRKTVSNYANAGPTKLWAIEQLIDDLMTKAKWDGPQKPPDSADPRPPRLHFFLDLDGPRLAPPGLRNPGNLWPQSSHFSLRALRSPIVLPEEFALIRVNPQCRCGHPVSAPAHRPAKCLQQPRDQKVPLQLPRTCSGSEKILDNRRQAAEVLLDRRRRA